MLSQATARRLKDAGLEWQPAKGDQFVVPDRGMDEQIYTLNDMAVIVESLQGHPAITFHGTPEWALDYVFVGEVIWLPDEGQLRARIQQALTEAGAPVFDLLYADETYTCRFEWNGEALAFPAATADESYAAALLYILGIRD
jgi:hypothetical protein